ncbi:MAG: hypothetical protein WAO78_16930 [Roseovarius sp.]
MVAKLTGAVLRAFLVALLLAMPSLLLPSAASDTNQIVVLISVLAGAMVFMEYTSRAPSIIEFRFAAPFNRMKFGFGAVGLLACCLIMRGAETPGSWSVLLTQLSGVMAAGLDFPYSPVRLLLSLLPPSISEGDTQLIRLLAALCYGLSMVMVFVFLALVRIWGWPVRRGAFNVWLNLPLFDPTGGGDVVVRLHRDSALNLSLGFLLPFLLPALVVVLVNFFDRSTLLSPQTVIWMIVIWAFVPAGMIMRGLALHRVAELITAKRRRAYAKAEDAFQTV